MKDHAKVAAGAVALVALLTSCSSSTTSSPTTRRPAASTVPAAVDPNAPEVVAPGDIPDNQAFVTFAPQVGGYSVSVPEGWARAGSNGGVTFTDKYNTIEIRSTQTATAPTIRSMRASGLADVAADPTFVPGQVSLVRRKAGTAVRATYEIGSAPNSVTGKKALLAVERYAFFRNGRLVVLTLSAAKGSDNVDPWRRVSDSVTWR